MKTSAFLDIHRIIQAVKNVFLRFINMEFWKLVEMENIYKTVQISIVMILIVLSAKDITASQWAMFVMAK